MPKHRKHFELPNVFFDSYIEEEVDYENPSELHRSILNKAIIEESFLFSKETLQDEINRIKDKILKEFTEKISTTNIADLTSTQSCVTRETATQTLYNLVVEGKYTSLPDIISNALWCIEKAQNALNNESTKNAQAFTAYASQFLESPLPVETSPRIVKVDLFLKRCAEVLFILEYTAETLFKQRAPSEDYVDLYNGALDRYHQDTNEKLYNDIASESFELRILQRTLPVKKGIFRILFLRFSVICFLHTKYTYEVAHNLPLIINLIHQTFISPPNDDSPQERGKKGAAARKETLDAAKAELKASVLKVMQAPEYAAHWTSKERACEFLAKHLLPGQSEKAQDKLSGQINRLFKSDEEMKTLYTSLNKDLKSAQKRK